MALRQVFLITKFKQFPIYSSQSISLVLWTKQSFYFFKCTKQCWRAVHCNFFSYPISSILMLSSQIETRSIWRKCIMKSSLGFLDSCGTNAPAGPANEFNLSAQPFSSPIHLLISCKWLFAVEVPVNKSTTYTLPSQQTIITWKHPDCVVLCVGPSLCLQCYSIRKHEGKTDSQLVFLSFSAGGFISVWIMVWQKAMFHSPCS